MDYSNKVPHCNHDNHLKTQIGGNVVVGNTIDRKRLVEKPLIFHKMTLQSHLDSDVETATLIIFE